MTALAADAAVAPPADAGAPPVDDAAPGRGRRRWRGVVVVAALVLTLGMTVRFVAEPLRVSSDSMAPTLRDGDHVLVDKLTAHWRDVRVDDLVVFPEPDTGDLAIKRVVGVAGDVVAIEDGLLHRNGRPVHEGYVDVDSIDATWFGPVTVPAGTVFVMGDERAGSIDSRAYGPVAVGDLVGRVVFSL